MQSVFAKLSMLSGQMDCNTVIVMIYQKLSNIILVIHNKHTNISTLSMLQYRGMLFLVFSPILNWGQSAWVNKSTNQYICL